MTAPSVDPKLRRTMMGWIALAALLTVAVWLAVFYLLPPFTGMPDLSARMVFTLGCCCVAILLCFVTGIEAVAHERLFSPAIDPLSGYETRRMRINLRYLQHTLEQLMMFVPGLFGLAYYCPDGGAMRAVAATTVVWIVTRFVFWISYHFGSEYRAFGAPGMAQSLLVLLYVSARFGFDLAGIPGALAPLLLFGGIEAYLFRATRPPA